MFDDQLNPYAATSRQSDPIDEANALAACMTESLVAQARLANAPQSHPDFDGETCVDCGDDIPEVRLNLGKVRCVTCQEVVDKRTSVLGRTYACGF